MMTNSVNYYEFGPVVQMSFEDIFLSRALVAPLFSGAEPSV